jgi:aspartate aminotransferase
MSAPVLAPRMDRIAASPSSILRRRAGQLRAAGRDVIELSSGDVGFPTPPHVVEAAHRAALAGETRYTNVDGAPGLKDAVRAAFTRNNDLTYARDEIIICNGSSQALFNALLATLTPGDEVIIPSPYWAPYLDQVRLTDGAPVVVPCAQNNGFKLCIEDLRAAITPRTRWLVLNNPVNPSGVVYSAAELSAIADVLLDHPTVWVLTDGLYEHIVFDWLKAPTIAQIEPRLKVRTLTVSGVAKSYAMTGWRVGYAGGPTDLIAAMARIQSHTTICASSISQAAALAALSGPQHLLAERAAILSASRDRCAALINDCPGLSCTRPQGTFYLFVCCAGVIGKTTSDGTRIATDRDFAAYLLDAVGVSVVAGEDHGLSPYVRVSFAKSAETIEEACRRIAHACAVLQ